MNRANLNAWDVLDRSLLLMAPKHKLINLWARWKTTSLLISRILFIFFSELVVRLKLNFISFHSSENSHSQKGTSCALVLFVRSFQYLRVLWIIEVHTATVTMITTMQREKKPISFHDHKIEGTNLYKLLFPSSDYIYYVRCHALKASTT